MNKKFLNVALFGTLIAVSSSTFTSCKDYDDDIDGLTNRVSAVEGTLSQLESLIKKGAVITDVKSTANGVVVTLSDNSSFTLTNGKDGAAGAAGAAGKNGTVVTMGTDGYWYVDGKKTENPWKGEKGNDGVAGTPGTNGKPGADGVTPDAVYFYPGTEGAAAGYWVKVIVKADGTKTEEVQTTTWAPKSSETVSAVWDTENGYLTLNGVAGSEAPIKIKLTDTLRSLAFVPEVIDQQTGLGRIDFYTLLKKKEGSDEYDFVVSTNPTVTYRLNPQNADVKNVEWSFIDRVVKSRVAGDNTDLVRKMKSEKDGKGGMNFTLQILKNLDFVNNDNEHAIIALKATNKEDASEIVSNYSIVKAQELTEFGIAKVKDGKPVAEPTSFYPTKITAVTVNSANDAELVYDKELDLAPIVMAWAKEIDKSLVAAGVAENEISYVYSNDFEFLGKDNETNQNKFISLEGSVVKVNKEWLAQGTAAVGRTPVVKVVAKVKGTTMATGFIKINIVRESTVAPDLEDLVVTVPVGEVEYSNIDANNGFKKVMTWEDANVKIYDALGLSKEDFAANYNSPSTEGTVPAGVMPLANMPGAAGVTGTNMIELTITNRVAVYNKPAKEEVAIKYPAKNNKTHRNVIVKFTYSIKHAKALPELNPDYLIGSNIIQVKGKMEGESWKLISEMKEQCKNYLSGYQKPGNHTKLFFRFKATTPVQEGAVITGTDYKDQTIKLTTPFTVKEDHKDYQIEMVATMANGEECVKEYIVRFVRPFNAEIDAITLKTFTATADTKDMSKLVVIKDRDGKVVYEKGAYTEYGKNTYKLDKAGLSFAYDVDADASFGGKLTVVNTTGKVEWYNGGNDLQQDKDAKSIATITIPEIAKIQTTGAIKVLSTEHSK